MGLGKFAAEALGEVAFMRILSGAWKWALGTFGEKVKEEAIKHIIDPRSWKDEHFFALDLAEAIAPLEKKKLIEEAMKRAQTLDRMGGTTYARNFRIIVTIYDDNPTTKGTPAVPEVPAKPAVRGTPAIPAVPAKPAVPGTKRPGIVILEELANTCTNVDEVCARIVAAGMLQDGHTTVEKFINFSKKVLWPFAMASAISTYDTINNRANALATKINEEEELEKAKKMRIDAMPSGGKKIFARFGFELMKYIKN